MASRSLLWNQTESRFISRHLVSDQPLLVGSMVMYFARNVPNFSQRKFGPFWVASVDEFGSYRISSDPDLVNVLSRSFTRDMLHLLPSRYTRC